MQIKTDLVHILDNESFEPFIESKEIVLVSVVALPEHDRSETFIPIFEKIAHKMQDTNITFAQINWLENGEVLLPYKLWELWVWPRVILFQGLDNVRHYHEPLKESDLVSYINRFLELPVLSTVAESSLPDFKKKNDAVVVGYIADEDEESQKQFHSLAEAMHPEFIFGISHSLELARSEGVEMPGLAVCRHRDAAMATVPLSNDVDQMMTTLRKAGRPLIIELAFNTHTEFLDMGIPFAYVFAETLGERSQLHKDIEPLARKYRRDAQFAIADPVDLGNIVQDLHLKVTHYPAFAIREPNMNLRYPMNEASNPVFIEAVEKHVQDFLNGDLKPTIKSEPLPPKDSKEALKKIVGLNYQDIVMDSSKDVFVTYCIDHCGPCEAFQPTLDKLAELYASHSKLKELVTVGKCMHGANDTPERGIHGFPAFKIFPAASKGSPEEFLGDWTFDNLADFIRDKGTFHAGLDNLGDQKTQV